MKHLLTKIYQEQPVTRHCTITPYWLTITTLFLTVTIGIIIYSKTLTLGTDWWGEGNGEFRDVVAQLSFANPQRIMLKLCLARKNQLSQLCGCYLVIFFFGLKFKIRQNVSILSPSYLLIIYFCIFCRLFSYCERTPWCWGSSPAAPPTPTSLSRSSTSIPLTIAKQQVPRQQARAQSPAGQDEAVGGRGARVCHSVEQHRRGRRH